MRIAAQLCRQPAVGCTGQVGRHQTGRTAEERERGRGHPPDAQRNEVGHPAFVAGSDVFEHAGSIRGRGAVGVSTGCKVLAQSTSLLEDIICAHEPAQVDRLSGHAGALRRISQPLAGW